MKPFDQIDTLEGVRALDAPVRGLNALSRVVSAPRRLRSVLAGEPFGHSAHPMLVQVPIGAWVSAGWLDCLPGQRTPLPCSPGSGSPVRCRRSPPDSSTTPTWTGDSAESPSSTSPPTSSHWRARSSRYANASPVASAAANGSGSWAPPPSPPAVYSAATSHTH